MKEAEEDRALVRAVTPPQVAEVRRSLSLSRERMARLFDVSAKTIERWEVRLEPPASLVARRRLAQLREIVELGTIVYMPEGFGWFLTTPMPAFDNRTALHLIETDQAERVLAALVEDYEGLGY